MQLLFKWEWLVVIFCWLNITLAQFSLHFNFKKKDEDINLEKPMIILKWMLQHREIEISQYGTSQTGRFCNLNPLQWILH